jgi:hypothetical protein
MHPQEVANARLLSKQIASPKRPSQPVANRKQTTIAIPVASAPSPVSTGLVLSTSNPVAETVGATASPGSTGLAADAGHEHAMPGAFVAAGASHAAGFVPDPGSTAHTVPYVLTESGWSAQTAIVNLGTVTVGVWNGSTIAAAYLPTASSSAFGICKVDGTTITASAGVISAVSSGGGGVTSDFISGCNLIYDTTTSIQINTGTVGLQSGGTYTVSSVITLSPTLAASTWYYVYLTSATTATVSTTAPSSNYQGYAWNDGTSTHRYLGAFKTDASSHIYNFVRVGDDVRYRANTAGSPFEVLPAGTATSSTSVSCSAVVPPTAQQMIAMADVGAGAAINYCYFGSSTGMTPTGSSGETFAIGSPAANQGNSTALTLNLASQAFLYCNTSASGSTCTVYALGYVEKIGN